MKQNLRIFTYTDSEAAQRLGIELNEFVSRVSVGELPEGDISPQQYSSFVVERMVMQQREVRYGG